MTSITRYNPARVLAVTLGLSAAGALVGGVAGAVALGIGLLFTVGLKTFSDLAVLLLPATIGALLGAVCAPLAGWLLLRRVPLGRAFTGLAVGTVLGGLAGWFSPLSFDELYQPIATAAAGFVAAAVLIRLRHRDKPSDIQSQSEDGIG